jgi:hypothetical protein
MSKQSLDSPTGKFLFGWKFKARKHIPGLEIEYNSSWGGVDASFDEQGTLVNDVVDGRTSMVNSAVIYE